jgi:hypothetical protein
MSESLTSNQQLAQVLARRIFACGDDGPTRRAVRLQYKTGTLQDEHDGGGFIESIFASYLQQLLDELRPASETSAPPDFAAAWHRLVESIATILEVNSNGSLEEVGAAIAEAIQRLRAGSDSWESYVAAEERKAGMGLPPETNGEPLEFSRKDVEALIALAISGKDHAETIQQRTARVIEEARGNISQAIREGFSEKASVSEPLRPVVECKCGRKFLTYEVGLPHVELCEGERLPEKTSCEGQS